MDGGRKKEKKKRKDEEYKKSKEGKIIRIFFPSDKQNSISCSTLYFLNVENKMTFFRWFLIELKKTKKQKKKLIDG